MNPKDEEPDFDELLDELDKDQTRIIIRAETRRFSKPTTIIKGLTVERGELERVARELKKSLATGGSAKEGMIILQGDHRESVKELLVKLGYSSSNIEVQ
jgi:translation initiation factor 1